MKDRVNGSIGTNSSKKGLVLRSKDFQSPLVIEREKQNRNKEMIWKKGKNRRRKQQSKEENQNFIVALFPFYVQYREAFKWRFYWTGFGVDLGAADWQSKQRDGITYSGSENRGGR